MLERFWKTPTLKGAPYAYLINLEESARSLTITYQLEGKKHPLTNLILGWLNVE